MVHRDYAILFLRSVADGKVRLIVSHSLRALMIDNSETVQTDAERQLLCKHTLLRVDLELFDCLSFTQMYHTLTPCEMSDECSQQDNNKRQMENDDRQTAHPSL